jgi:hypothetical protein
MTTSSTATPLPAEHRRLLVREARTYALTSLFPTFPLLLFLIFALSPASLDHRVVLWPMIALCGVALAVCLSSCRACVMDARGGHAEVRVRRLNRRRDSPRYPTIFYFEDSPTQARLPTSWPRMPPTPEGAWYRITYSPRSATLWSIEPVSEPQGSDSGR